MKSHASELQQMLGWTDLQLSHKLNQTPILLCSQPSTIAQNIKELQMHNFTPAQARHICASQASLAGRNWSSDNNLDKLHFLVDVLHMTPDDIAARPVCLTYSLTKRIGPRVEFLCQCGFMDPAIPLSHYLTMAKSFFTQKLHS